VGQADTGWQPDPFGLHEFRYFSGAGKPTKLVRDNNVESFDDPPAVAILDPRLVTGSPASREDHHVGVEEVRSTGIRDSPQSTTSSHYEQPVFMPQGVPLPLTQYCSYCGNPLTIESRILGPIVCSDGQLSDLLVAACEHYPRIRTSRNHFNTPRRRGK
jgi:hypothetical protein